MSNQHSVKTHCFRTFTLSKMDGQTEFEWWTWNIIFICWPNSVI